MFDLERSTVRVLSQPPYAVSENGNTNLVFTFDRTFGGFPDTFGYLTADFALTGSADAGADYSTNPGFNRGFGLNSDWGTVTFYPGSATATLSVTPISDGIVEGNETITVQLIPRSGYNIGVPQLASGTIIDGTTGNGETGGGGGTEQNEPIPRTNHIFGTNGPEELAGTNGADCILGMSGNDVLQGEGGNDKLLGHDGNDILLGGSGNDKLLGHNGSDILIGDAGNDKLNGGKGQDVLDGVTGNNKIRCGPGKDFVVLNKGFGKDKVLDFNTKDKFILGSGLRQFRQLDIFQRNNNTLIASNDDILAIAKNFDASDLTQRDFISL